MASSVMSGSKLSGSHRRVLSVSEMSSQPAPAPAKTPSCTAVSETPERSTSRSRKPWDANGYSFSMAQGTSFHNQAGFAQSPPESQPADSPVGSPPGHHYSLSNESSCTAYTQTSSSSPYSAKHSRDSSTSTSPNTPESEKACFGVESADILQRVELTRVRLHNMDMSLREGRAFSGTERSGGMSDEQHASEQHASGLPSHEAAASAPGEPSPPASESGYYSYNNPRLHIHTLHQWPELAEPLHADERDDGDEDRSKAPMPADAARGAASKLPTPAKAYYDTRRPIQVAPELVSTPVPYVDFSAPHVCGYEVNCDLDYSNPRKGISQYFGRNKTCTRLMPHRVWVELCRKHYQRLHYRSGLKYAMTQVGYVSDHVRRAQEWSRQNYEKGSGFIVADWHLALRKCEQERQDKKSAVQEANYSQGMRNQDDLSDDEGGGMGLGSRAKTGPSPPAWLVDRCDKTYSTQDILAILDGLNDDIRKGHLERIPDIEILPSYLYMPGDGNAYKLIEKKPNKSALKGGESREVLAKQQLRRKVLPRARSAHRQTQSVNLPSSTAYVNYPSYPGPAMHPSQEPAAKRQRTMPIQTEYAPRAYAPPDRFGMGHSELSYRQPGPSQQSHPSHQSQQSHQSHQSQYSPAAFAAQPLHEPYTHMAPQQQHAHPYGQEQAPHGHQRHASSSAFAPVPRMAPSPLTSRMHQRSRSEAVYAGQGRPGYRSAYPPVPTPPHSYGEHSRQHSQQRPPQLPPQSITPASDDQSDPFINVELPPLRAMLGSAQNASSRPMHVRHQSVPTVHPALPQPSLLPSLSETGTRPGSLEHFSVSSQR